MRASLTRLSALSVALGLWSLAACNSGRQDEPSLPLVYGGTPVQDGEWPSVVGLAFAADAQSPFYLECTGTLITPRVVLTAGHCLKSGNFDVQTMGDAVKDRLRIYTGLGAEGGQVIAAHAVERAIYHPLLRVHPIGYGDLGLVILQDPIYDIEPVELVKSLKDQRAATEAGLVSILGYGRREDLGRGVKYLVETTLREATSNEAIAGGDGKDSCAGDSGGPAFVKLPGAVAKGKGSPWRQVGVVSRSLKVECGQGGYISLASDGICWIESEIGESLPGVDTHCEWRAPSYDDAALKTVDFTAFCEGKAGNATQRESARQIRLGLGAASCAEAGARLATTAKLSLDYLMIRDVSPLVGLTSVTSLSLRGNRIRDLAPLGTLPALKMLAIQGNDVEDLDSLAAGEAQGLLILGKRRQLHNVAATDFITACQSTTTSDAARRTVSAVKARTMAESCDQANERLLGMRTLSLRDRGLTDVSPLADLQQIETLDLSLNPGVDVSPLASLESLRKLDLTNSGVTDLAPLAALIARGLVVTGVP